MKKFCESLREYVKYIIDFEKKNMPSSTKKEIKTHQDAKVCYICGKKILKNSLKVKIVEQLETMVIIQVNIEVQLIVYVI